MGSCLSKKCPSSVKVSSTNQETKPIEKKEEVEIVRKEIFVIKHRISHEGSIMGANGNSKKATESAKNSSFNVVSGPVRSSCTKEEFEDILVQCGKLSRSKGPFSGFGESSDNHDPSTSRNKSNSKKSCDFDNESINLKGSTPRGYFKNANEATESAKVANVNGESSKKITRTPSFSKEVADATSKGPSFSSWKKSDSKKSWDFDNESRSVGSRGGSRRVSRSPSKRSESPNTASNCANGSNVRLGKIIPATVSAADVQRIQVLRNVGTASPRARSPSPARKVSNEHQNFQQQPLLFLSRSNSRKKESSPFRRNPLCEIESEPMPSRSQKLAEEAKAVTTATVSAAVSVAASGLESLVPWGIRRSRSAMLSQDLDINNVGVVSNPTQSYTDLLLKDIQNFHQKSSNPPEFSLPPCVTKAHAILDAVADLNSSTSSCLSSALSEDRTTNPTVERLNKNPNASLRNNLPDKKYVTYRRETDESLKSKPSLVPPSSREPDSADSNDCWAPSKSYSRLHMNPLAFLKHTAVETGLDTDGGERRMTANMMDSEIQQRGIGRNAVEPRGIKRRSSGFTES